MEFFGVKFAKHKFDSIEGKTVVHIQVDGDKTHQTPWTIIISQSGIKFWGELLKDISSEKELESFAELIGLAWAEHKNLVPKLFTNLSGH